MIKIASVHPGSIAEAVGLSAGTELVSVNGHELEDFLDWEYHSSDEELTLFGRQPDGTEFEIEIERDLDDPIGLTLEPPRIRRCANRCDFCFVDGNPEGLREVLYIRDDDYRLSFRYGNFATLSNLKPKDVERIVTYRLSPLYVSVHATDLVARRYLLRNPVAPDIMEQLRYFAAHGIRFHTQIVMSPGVNDGEILRRSIDDLYQLGDPILSVSVVPVGLTEFSKHHRCREPDVEECRAAISLLEEWGARARRERGVTWVFGADELYLRANQPLPPAELYGGFEQVENGVGAVRFLQQEVAAAADELSAWKGKRIGIVTGTSMAALMGEVVGPLSQVSGASFEVMAVSNSVFGARVTTAGLLPGRDIRTALADRRDLDFALIPGEALNDSRVFIDDLSLSDLRASVPMPVRPSKYFGDALDE